MAFSVGRRALLAAVLVLMASGVDAQYFGQNKVQYKKLDFRVLATDHFDIYYYPEEQDGVQIAARMAERWRARLGSLLDHELSGRQPLLLYASHVDFEQTNAIQGAIGEGTGGVTEPLRRRIILPMAGPLADTDHVLGHELVHAFQFDIASGRRENGGPGRGIERLPLWFIEGMAEYFSLGAEDVNTSMWLRDAARRDKLPTIRDLNNPKYFPYRWGQAFWAYIGGRFGDATIATILKVAVGDGDAEGALTAVLKMKTDELSAEWHDAIKARYAPLISASMPPNEVGTLIIGGKKGKGETNVGPAISPDGRRIAFLSERSLLSFDLYVADAANGEHARRLTSTASDPHYSSLQFISSAGAWAADSKRLAIATVVGGRPAIAVFDADSGKRVRELRIADVDEVFSPTWSPDSRSIAFTGMTRGLTDLFVVDIDSGQTRALTHDAFAELQPAWSPDGQSIAFATDRFSSNLDTLAFNGLTIARITPGDGRVTPLGGFENARNFNPQWSADGAQLYFISDRNGVPNLARAGTDGSPATLLTNLSTGISGITSTSPALSVAPGAGVAAVSVYDEGRYDIYTRPLQQSPPAQFITGAAMLPPADRNASQVRRVLADSATGNPTNATYETRPYKARFGLDALGQPTIGVGASRFGTFVGGGISAFFSDVLGDKNLGVGVSVDSSVSGSFSGKDTAAQVSYLDQSRRLNWGLVGGQVPYLSGGYQEGITTVDGVPSLVSQTLVLRQTERSAAGIVAYPFSRAQRLEFQAGVTQYSFDQIVRTQAYDLASGLLFFDQTDTQSIDRPLTLGNTAAALVFDTSSFGATSPVAGQRYRLEVAPTFGNLTYTSVLADYRRYLMPAPFFTIAARVLHFGRYGSGAEDFRLNPLYLGYPTLVRGYDVNTFDASDCQGDGTSCRIIDQLIGSRMLVGNLEFRFPLLRPFRGPSAGMYGPLPVEVALFTDGGVTWNQGESPSFLGGHRDGVGSAGVSLRTNLFGFAIGEFAFVRPFQRRNQGWVFQFNLAPGF